MKRALIILSCALLAVSFAAAQVTPIELSVKDARSMGMGGAFTALSTGYQTFFGNPAGFGSRKASFSIASSAWAYVAPTSGNIEDLATIPDQTQEDQTAIMNRLLTENGLGAGAAFGVGYAGRGLGLGFNIVTEQYARGETLLGTQFSSATQGNVVVGMAVPIGSERFNLTIGGDLRPFFRIDGAFPASDMMSSLLGGSSDPLDVVRAQSARFGFGLAADLGASIRLGALSAGLTIRDLAPAFAFDATDFGSVIDALSAGSFPETSSGGDKALFIPNVTFGASFAPRFLPGLIDPAVYFEVQDPFHAIKDKASFWNLLHAGTEIRLLSFIYLRGGINKGWLSAGAGLDLFIFELDAAVFSDELGRRPGDKGRSGVAINAAFRI